MKRLFTILLAVLSLLSLTACGGSPTEETSQEPLVDIQPQEPEAPPEPTPEELAAQLTAKGTITATAQGSRDAVVSAASAVPGLTDVKVTDEKGGEVSFTAVSTAGTDLRGALSLALAQAGCPVLSLSAETMSLEDVFLQLTEAPDAAGETPPAPETQTEEKEANGDDSDL